MANKNNISIKPNKHETDFANKILGLIENSPCSFWTVKNQKDILAQNGFVELFEGDTWEIKPGGKYFVTRNESSLIAFVMPKGQNPQGFMMVNSHSDFPALKLKPEPEINFEDKYTKLNVEVYGGPILTSWFDCPLSIAGKIFVKTANGVKSKLVDLKKPVALIPSLALHQRKDKETTKINNQIDLQPLIGGGNTKSVIDLIAANARVAKNKIIDTELFVYRCDAPVIWGAQNEYASCRSFDDMSCAFGSLFGLIEAKPKKNIALHVVFDNEEIGSCTRQGAASNFLEAVWNRICEALDVGAEGYYQMIENSMAICSDNAHAIHPNRSEVADPNLHPYLGAGPVLKYSAKFAYSTDSVSASIVKKIAENNKIKLQEFVNRSDAPSGSSLCKFLSYHASVKAADVGLCQLAMHSTKETCAVRDFYLYKEYIRAFFSTDFCSKCDGTYEIM